MINKLAKGAKLYGKNNITTINKKENLESINLINLLSFNFLLNTKVNIPIPNSQNLNGNKKYASD